MIIKNASLDTVCGITSSFPENELCEIAFAGKSNVGKSSLINGLMNRKNLARTSSEPGKTQTINYYYIEGSTAESDKSQRSAVNLYFVDLPGYGYAKVSKEVSAKWGKMIEKYLHTSKTLKAVFLLIDIRHDPSANDKQMYDWVVAQGYEPIIIATKLDKINKSQRAKQVKAIRTALKASASLEILPFSATTREGIEAIYAKILEVTMQS